mgnify:CR=1 FL=1
MSQSLLNHDIFSRQVNRHLIPSPLADIRDRHPSTTLTNQLFSPFCWVSSRLTRLLVSNNDGNRSATHLYMNISTTMPSYILRPIFPPTLTLTFPPTLTLITNMRESENVFVPCLPLFRLHYYGYAIYPQYERLADGRPLD